MKTNLKIAFTALALVTLGFSACKKDDDNSSNPASDSDAIIENSAADNAFNDAANIADQGYSGNLSTFRTEGNNGSLIGNCASVTFDTLNSLKTFTIDFGNSNCVCHDGNTRRGKIKVSFNNGFSYTDSGSTHIITFDNYYVNDNQIIGTKTVANQGRNSQGKFYWTIVISGSIQWSAAYGGGTSTYNSNRVRVWSEGEGSPLNWLDDVYLISGTSNGVTRNGGVYSMNTQTPLRVDIGYRYFTDGILEWTPQGKSTRQINYGYPAPGKDNLAQVTIDGTNFVITLR